MSTSPPNDPWQDPGSGSTSSPPPPTPPPPPGPNGNPGYSSYPPPPPPGGGGSPGGYPPFPGGGSSIPPPPGSWQQDQGNSARSVPFGYLAGWWLRVAATLVDGLVVGIVVVLILFALGVRGYGLSVGNDLAQMVYAILMLSRLRGQTIGNMAAGTKVVNANTGGPLTLGQSAVRAVTQVILNITVVGGILDILWPLWDRQCQTLHDKAAGTVVLRLR